MKCLKSKIKIIILMLVLFVSPVIFVDKVFGDAFDFPSDDSTLTTPTFSTFFPAFSDVGFFCN